MNNNKKIFVAAIALIDWQGKVLLTSRSRSKIYSDCWEFPGGKIKKNAQLVKVEVLIEKVQKLIMKYPNVFILPLDFAVEKNGKRIEKDIADLDENDEILDIGHKTVEKYSKIISFN